VYNGLPSGPVTVFASAAITSCVAAWIAHSINAMARAMLKIRIVIRLRRNAGYLALDCRSATRVSAARETSRRRIWCATPARCRHRLLRQCEHRQRTAELGVIAELL